MARGGIGEPIGSRADGDAPAGGHWLGSPPAKCGLPVAATRWPAWRIAGKVAPTWPAANKGARPAAEG